MRKPTLARRLEIIAALREPTRLRLYEYVERRLEPVSRDEAAEAVGVSRAMAAFHLDRLTELGLLMPSTGESRDAPGAGPEGRPSSIAGRATK